MLPKEELLWFLFVKLDDELAIGIGTGTYGVAILHEKKPQFSVQKFKVHSPYKPCFLFLSRTVPKVKDRKCHNFQVKATLRYCFGRIYISIEMVHSSMDG